MNINSSQSAPAGLNRGRFRATRAKNVLNSTSGYGEKQKLNIFCPKCAQMGTVSDVLLGKCCTRTDPEQKRGHPPPGEGERRRRRDEELLKGEVFFPKQAKPTYNPNRIVDLARPNVNNQSVKREHTGRAKTELDWQIYRASQTPGPGDHNLPSTLGKVGAKISNAKFKTELDWIITNGPKMPGPGAYGAGKSTMSRQGGIISKSKPKSDVDWRCYHASKMPGPSNYVLPSTLNITSGGRFNQSEPKTALDWEIYRASQIPGPCATHTELDALSGGRFSHAAPSKYSKAELESMRSPGPGAYNI
jgi:hypothetical protein